jgi:HK97 family phage portal protein
MSRFGIALKAFVNPQNYNQDFEKNFLTILRNAGFGEKDLKKVLEDGFVSNTYVYSIINRIAEAAADIPIIIEQKNSRGEIEIVNEGDFYDFVHKPNSRNNYKSLTYQSIVYQLATGNEVQYGVKPSGFNYFTERWNLAPQYIEPKVKETIVGPIATSYKYNYSGTEYSLDVDEVMHLTKFNPDPASKNAVMGLSPLEAAWRTLVASNETITADASLIKNKGAFGLISAKGDRPNTKEEGKALDKALKNKIGGGTKYGSFPITNGQFDFVKLAMSPQDLQILENGVMKLRDLCSIYGVSSRMFNDPNGTTFNNSKEDGKKFYTQGVLPPLENDLDHFNNFFVQGWNERDNTTYKVKLDISSIEALQEDKKREAEKDKIFMDGVSVILNMPISEEGKRVLLMDNYGFDEDSATIITTRQDGNNE